VGLAAVKAEAVIAMVRQRGQPGAVGAGGAEAATLHQQVAGGRWQISGGAATVAVHKQPLDHGMKMMCSP
jgi:hypothetical protein